MLGDGEGGFALSLHEPFGEGTSVACGDFDGDGRDDVALLVEPDMRLGVLLAGANGSLQLNAWYPIPLAPTGVAVGDVRRRRPARRRDDRSLPAAARMARAGNRRARESAVVRLQRL
jgi:hypothetical protein